MHEDKKIEIMNYSAIHWHNALLSVSIKLHK